MIPWPIALLACFYTATASLSATMLWKHGQGSPVAWLIPSLWCAASLTLVAGLAFVKPWARRLAVWTSGLMIVIALIAAVLSVVQAHPDPGRSFVATGWASLHLLIVRYLTRKHVKAYFGSGERCEV